MELIELSVRKCVLIMMTMTEPGIMADFLNMTVMMKAVKENISS